MTWGQELSRAVLLTFGTTEIITNLTHLTRKNGLTSARKQHGELPENISDNKIRTKVICMLISGIAFFIASLLCFILHRYLHSLILTTCILFSLYGVTEALYYRCWKTCGFASVTILMLIFSIII